MQSRPLKFCKAIWIRKMRKTSRTPIIIIAIFLLISTGFSIDKTVLIPRGSGVAGVAQALKKAHIIHSSWLFRARVRLSGRHPIFYSGLMRLSLPASTGTLLRQLQDPTRLTYQRLTIPEGFNLVQIDDLLSSQEMITQGSFLAFCTDPSQFQPVIEKIPSLSMLLSVASLEGLLYPDTYHVEYYSSVQALVRLMLTNFANKALPVYTEYANSQPTIKKWQKVAVKTRRGTRYQRVLVSERVPGISLYQALKFASIVENEAKAASERPIIASVYLNRARNKMALGSCPTVEYARMLAGLPHKATLSFKDLEIVSPYNTYKHGGLPPTPISNPGIASIKAVLYPAHSNYLYFVSKGDGTHHFSTTAAEHAAWSNKLNRK